MFRSLRFRLMLVVGLAAVVPLLALAFFWSQDLRDRARVELGEEQANLAEVVGDQVGAMVEDIQRLLETTARLPLVRSGGRAEVEALFARIESGRIAGGQLLAARRDGVMVAARGAQGAILPPSVAAASGFRHAVEARGFGAGDPDPEGPLGRGLVDFWYPVTDEAGAIVRLVGLALDARVFGGAWDRLRLGAGGAVVLLGRNGRVVAQTPAGEAGFGRDVSAAPLWAEMLRLGSGTGEGVLTEDGVRRVYGFRQVAGPSWVLAIGVPPVLAASRALPPLSWTAAGVLVLLLACLGALAWGIAGNVTGAVQALAAASRRLAAADLRNPVERTGPGEIVAVASNLERIRHRLLELEGALEAQRAAAAVRERQAADHDEGRSADLPGRASELAIFHAVASAVSQPADRGPMYEPFLAQLLSHLGMDAGALYLVGDQRELRLLAQVGHSVAALETMARLPVGEGIAGRVAQDGDPLVVEDASVEARLVRDVVRLEGFHGLAALPLSGRRRTLGVLEVVTRARRRLGGYELKVLQTASQHIGLALVNAALQEEAERRAARLHTLARLTQSMTASLSSQEVLYLAVLATAQLLEPAYVRVWLWDPATGRAQPGPWHGQADLAEEGAPGTPGMAREEDIAAARAPEVAVAALAARGGEPVFIPQTASDPRCPEPRWWAQRGAVSVAALPLGIGERTLGVLIVVPRGASVFPEEDRELLGFLASQAAVAFENTRLYQERAAAPPEAPSTPEGLPLEAETPEAVAVPPADAAGAAPPPAAVGAEVEPIAAGSKDARLDQDWGAGPPQPPGSAEERQAGIEGLEPAAIPSAGSAGAAPAPAGMAAEVEPVAAGVGSGPDLAWAGEALAGLDAAVAAADDVESALEVIADEVRHIVGADVAAVFRLDHPRLDGTGRRLHLAAGGLLFGVGAGLDGEAGVVGAALADRAARAAVAPFGDAGEETLETLALSIGYRAVAAAAILEGKSLAGALAVCRRGPEPFEEKALAALMAVAARVAAVWTDRARTANLRGKT